MVCSGLIYAIAPRISLSLWSAKSKDIYLSLSPRVSMDSQGLTEKSLRVSSIEPIVALDGVLAVLDNNVEVSTIHASSQKIAHNTHPLESGRHRTPGNQERRTVFGQGSKKIVANSESRTMPQQQNAIKQPHKKSQLHHSQSSHSSNPGGTKSRNFSARVLPNAVHSSHRNHQLSSGSHLHQQRFHHSFSGQDQRQQNVVLHHLNHEAELEMDASSKFNDRNNTLHESTHVMPTQIHQNTHNSHSNHLSSQTAHLDSLVSRPNLRPIQSTHQASNDTEAGYSSLSSVSYLSLRENQLKQSETIRKLENEVDTLTQDISYFRHVIDYQGLKIDKLTQLIIDLLHNKEVPSVVQLLQNIHAADPFTVSEGDETVDSIANLVQENIASENDNVHEVTHSLIHDVESSMASIPSLTSSSIVDVPDSVVLLEGNIETLLHQVAQAAVRAQSDPNREVSLASKSSFRTGSASEISHANNPRQKVLSQQDLLSQENHQVHHLLQSHQHMELSPNAKPSSTGLSALHPPRIRKSTTSQTQDVAHVDRRKIVGLFEHLKRKDSMSVVSLARLEVENIENMARRKKPKLNIDFLHNPMTVKEIYTEFTKGFRGQPPLRELDDRFGKQEWRGDSRTKESKRFQRRRKLCEAIERGMAKYDKSAEEIIQYMEEFRNHRSLTWMMNGNLPKDLLED